MAPAGNFATPPDDYLVMDCDQAREALSALIDDEDAGVSLAALSAHLEGCAACTGWKHALAAVRESAGVGTEPGPDVLPALLGAVSAERAAVLVRREQRRLVPWRVGLAAVAVIQPLLVLPSLLAGHWLDHAHDARELGSWHLALAVGFVFAAVRPARAWGMLPLVAALVVGLMVTAGIDVADGEVGVVKELAHVVDVAGLACLWALSTRVDRPTARLALA